MKALKRLASVAVLIFGFFLFPSNICLAVQNNTIVIPAATFVPNGSSSSNLFFKSFEGYFEYTGATGTTAAFLAPVNFPEKCAKIDKVSVFLLDYSAGAASFTLFRHNMATGITEPIGSVQSTNTGSVVTRFDMPLIPFRTQVSATYSYYLGVSTVTDILIFGAKVKYTNAP